MSQMFVIAVQICLPLEAIKGESKLIEQKVLPVISDWKTFEKFLQREETWCILMDFHVNFVEELLTKLHEHQKKGIVHMDLIRGLSNDIYGTQFMCQKYHVDGIISTKPRVIEYAKKNHCLSIFRVFLIDTRSLEKGSIMAEELQPDYVEVLPAIIPDAVSKMRKHCQVKIIGGGLIHGTEDIEFCLKHGMSAVSTSNLGLCDWRPS